MRDRYTPASMLPIEAEATLPADSCLATNAQASSSESRALGPEALARAHSTAWEREMDSQKIDQELAYWEMVQAEAEMRAEEFSLAATAARIIADEAEREALAAEAKAYAATDEAQEAEAKALAARRKVREDKVAAEIARAMEDHPGN